MPGPRLLPFLFGVTCSGCSTPGQHLCDACIARAATDRRRAPTGAVLPDTWPYNRILRRAKFEGTTAPIMRLIPVICDSVQELLGKEEMAAAGICPVPAFRPRSQWRGTDLPRLVAREVSRILDIPELSLFSRCTSGRQRRRSRRDRVEHASGMFICKPEALISCDPTHPIIIIDDVTATGATRKALTQLLAEQGYRALSLAITGVPDSRP